MPIKLSFDGKVQFCRLRDFEKVEEEAICYWIWKTKLSTWRETLQTDKIRKPFRGRKLQCLKMNMALKFVSSHTGKY